MVNTRISFKNMEGMRLSAHLEMPPTHNPIAYAIFAHCFTCTQNFSATKNITRSLALRGIATLRFDFTGLGSSEGDFSEADFSSNLTDLIAAAEYLETNYQAPQLLIGHSLGGAAVLAVASQIASIKAVASIGAPSKASHVKHLFKDQIDQIEAGGVADVNIGGRSFKVRKEFLTDLDDNSDLSRIKNMGKAILVMHSPQDAIVDITNAKEIYEAAHHPKSFVTLDGADHLLMNVEDSMYAAETIAQWSSRYIDSRPEYPLLTEKQAIVSTKEQGYTTEIQTGSHQLVADEPKSVGGNDHGPSPYDLLVSALGACTSMTLRMYADRKKWDLKEVRVHLQHEKAYAQDSADPEQGNAKIDQITREIELYGELDETQRARLLEIADKCPVHKTLHSQVVVKTKLKD